MAGDAGFKCFIVGGPDIGRLIFRKDNWMMQI
jgi:hypothetical protein